MSGRMTDDLIEAYVADVIRHLPGKQRNDVGFELRALLQEDLKSRAGDLGRQPDDAIALDLLREFGRPDEVAARYHPPGVPIIPPAQTRGFVWATVIGVGLQWSVSLPLAISGALPLAGPSSARITAWWISYGLGALWWPGFLVTVMIAAAWVRRTWPAADQAWKPAKAAAYGYVNRGLYALGLAAALCGIALWVLLAWSTATFSNPFTRALAFGPEFLATRAPVVLVYWSAGIALLALLIVEGRWRVLTRRIDLGLKLACCALLAWLALGGRIFLADQADQSAKSVLGLLIVVILGELAVHAWRLRNRIRSPAEVRQL
jgi:hypothetical protein